jgi:mannose-1-phosphate guanylyltransferase
MPLSNWPSIAEKTLAVIMGGGAGTRLFPLTKERSKPAVPLAGKYRWSTSRSATAIKFRPAAYLCADAVQQHLTAQAHKFQLQIRQFLEELC